MPIRKLPNKDLWVLTSNKGKKLGTFKSRKAAEKRGGQIAFFKSAKK